MRQGTFYDEHDLNFIDKGFIERFEAASKHDMLDPEVTIDQEMQ